MDSVTFKENVVFENILKQNRFKMRDDIFKYILIKWFNGENTILPKYIEYPFGTIEWITKRIGGKEIVGQTWNSHEGCPNGCIACYACLLAWQKNFSFWVDYGAKITRKKKWIVNWQRKPTGYIFMYPSMHDTFIYTVDDANKVIANMLKANGEVLFVSKPRLDVIKIMIDEFTQKKYERVVDKITGRFSISTDNDLEVEFWETNAPRYAERRASLIAMKKAGINVGSSCEPFLIPKEGKNIKGFISVVKVLLKDITDTLWAGTMNHLPEPTTKESIAKKYEEMKDKYPGKYPEVPDWDAPYYYTVRNRVLTEYETKKFDELKEFHTFDNVFEIVKAFWQHPQVMWKESVKKVMVKHIRKNPVYA